MLEQLTSEQVTEWKAYDRLEPIGEMRGDLRMAILASLIANIANSFATKGKPIRTYTPADFMPKWEEEITKPAQSVEEMKRILESLSGVRKKRRK